MYVTLCLTLASGAASSRYSDLGPVSSARDVIDRLHNIVPRDQLGAVQPSHTEPMNDVSYSIRSAPSLHASTRSDTLLRSLHQSLAASTDSETRDVSGGNDVMRVDKRNWRNGATWGKRAGASDTSIAEEKRWRSGGATWGKKRALSDAIDTSIAEEKRWRNGATWGKRKVPSDTSIAEEKRWRSGGATWGKKRALSDAIDTSIAEEKRWRNGATWGKRKVPSDTSIAEEKRWRSGGATWGKRALSDMAAPPSKRWHSRQTATWGKRSGDIRADKRWKNSRLSTWGKRASAPQSNDESFNRLDISKRGTNPTNNVLAQPIELDTVNTVALSRGGAPVTGAHVRERRSLQELLERHFIEDDEEDYAMDDVKRAWDPFKFFSDSDWLSKRGKWTGPKRGWNGPVKQSWGKRDMAGQLGYTGNYFMSYPHSQRLSFDKADGFGGSSDRMWQKVWK